MARNKSAYESAASFLARREHSRQELQQKLARHYSHEDITHALDKLQAEGLLCEQRFVESIMQSTANRYGRALLQQKLTQYGIAASMISDALAMLPDETERAIAVLQQKYKTSSSPLPAAKMQQAWRFLQSRGFDAETTEKVIGKFFRDAQIDDEI